MSKKELLIALLKSEQSLAKSKSNNPEIEQTKKVFNELRNKFPKLKIKEIRKKLYEKEKIDKYFKELDKKNEEKKVKKMPRRTREKKTCQIIKKD